jgi:hypothetical protein
VRTATGRLIAVRERKIVYAIRAAIPEETLA